MVIEHLNQPDEERRGANVELARGHRVAAQAAAAATVEEMIFLDGRAASDDYGSLVRRIQLVFDAAVTGVVTNNATINILAYPVVAGVLGAAVTVATLTFGNGTNAAKGVPIDVSTGAGFPFAFPASSVLSVQKVQNGTGLALPAFLMVIEHTRLDRL